MGKFNLLHQLQPPLHPKNSQGSPSVRAVFLNDAVSEKVRLDGTYEKVQLNALKRLVFNDLDNASNCIDIGANIGNHACTFAKSFANVYAFEANPPVSYVLRANAFGKNITVFDYGLSDKNGTIPFKQFENNLGASCITANEADADYFVDIQTLDSVVKKENITNISFVKIDVEGHETEVLEGGRLFFSEQKPVIALEAFFQSAPKNGKATLSLLRSYGYRHMYALEHGSKSYRFIRRVLGARLTRVLFFPFLTKQNTVSQLTEVVNPLTQNHQMLLCSHRKLM